MSVKIYVAAPWKDKAYAKEVKDKLVAEGFTVTSRWIDFHEDKPADNSGLDYSKTVLIKEAKHDVIDVFNSDLLLLLNTQKRGEETSGKAVEVGMAMAWLKPVIVVGEISNIFHHICPVFPTVDEAVSLIKQWQANIPLIATPSSGITLT